MEDDDIAATEALAELEMIVAFEEIDDIDVVVGAAIRVESYDPNHQYVSTVFVQSWKHTLC